jgi:hypothetical protein
MKPSDKLSEIDRLHERMKTVSRALAFGAGISIILAAALCYDILVRR